jgi:hypothetical protein
MGTSTDSKHVRSTVAGDIRVGQHEATPQDNLSAKTFLERRMTTIEAEVAAKMGQPTYRSQTPDEDLTMETLHVCNAQLQIMLTPNWLSRSPIRVSIHQQQLDEITSSQTEYAERAKATLERLFAGFCRSMKQDEIRKTGVVMTFVAKSECVKPHFKSMLNLLGNLDIALRSDTPDALSKAENILRKGRRVITSMVKSITATLEENSSETLEAKRLDRIQQAAEKQREVYRNSDEYRALRLLALVDDRLTEGKGNTLGETKLARKLSSLGFDGVERILLGLAPSLGIEASHLQALRAIFDEIATSNHSMGTEHSGAQLLDVEESSASANSHKSESQAVTQEALEAQAVQDYLSIEQSPDAIEFKQLLLEELGVKDSHEREYLSRAMTLQGIENVREIFNRLPPHVISKILECNPKLLDPASEINLPMFCRDLRDFIDKAYDLHGVDEFDPMSTPANFKDHAALGKTKKLAAAFRLDRQRSEDSENTRG